jgi:hypothetical protein
MTRRCVGGGSLGGRRKDCKRHKVAAVEKPTPPFATLRYES